MVNVLNSSIKSWTCLALSRLNQTTKVLTRSIPSYVTNTSKHFSYKYLAHFCSKCRLLEHVDIARHNCYYCRKYVCRITHNGCDYDITVSESERDENKCYAKCEIFCLTQKQILRSYFL